MAITDNFNRADENPLSNGGTWGKSGSTFSQCRVVSNQVTGQAAAESSSAYTGSNWNNDQTSALATITIDGVNGVGAWTRSQGAASPGSADSGYLAFTFLSGGVYRRRLYRYDAGVSTAIGSNDGGVAPSQVKCSATGTTIQYDDQSVSFTATDSTYAGGVPGVYVSQGGVALGDNWTGTGEIVVTTAEIAARKAHYPDIIPSHWNIEVVEYW